MNRKRKIILVVIVILFSILCYVTLQNFKENAFDGIKDIG